MTQRSATAIEATRSHTRITSGLPANNLRGFRGRRLAPSLAGITASVLIRGARGRAEQGPRQSRRAMYFGRRRTAIALRGSLGSPRHRQAESEIPLSARGIDNGVEAEKAQ